MITRWAGTALLGLVAIVLSLLLLEGGLRWLAPQYVPDIGLKVLRDAQGVPRLPANRTLSHRDNSGEFLVSVQINASGFRDSIEPGDIAPEDLVIVGDSFPFGWGVERPQRISERLAAILKRRVVNLALPGLGPADYRAVIEHVSQGGTSPSAYLLFITVENDLAPVVSPDAGHKNDQRCVWACLRQWLSQHTATWHALAATLKQSAARPWLEKVGVVRDVRSGVEKSVRFEPDFSPLLQQLSALHGLPVMLVIVPSRGLWLSDYQHKSEQLHRALVERLQQTGMPLIDLALAFVGTGTPARLHFKHDPHWNAEGHRVAAEAMANHLGRQWPASNP